MSEIVVFLQETDLCYYIMMYLSEKFLICPALIIDTAVSTPQRHQTFIKQVHKPTNATHNLNLPSGPRGRKSGLFGMRAKVNLVLRLKRQTAIHPISAFTVKGLSQLSNMDSFFF